jgi:hypothetical protein
MPQSPLTGHFKEKPTFRVRCLYNSFVHGTDRGKMLETVPWHQETGFRYQHKVTRHVLKLPTKRRDEYILGCNYTVSVVRTGWDKRKGRKSYFHNYVVWRPCSSVNTNYKGEDTYRKIFTHNQMGYRKYNHKLKQYRDRDMRVILKPRGHNNIGCRYVTI